jgi:hypothetical protein
MIPNYSKLAINYSGTVTANANAGLNKLSYDLGFGAFYSIANKMYVGISSYSLSSSRFSKHGR